MTQKLKRLKGELKKINREGFLDIQIRATQAYQDLIHIQNLMHTDPGNTKYSKKEKAATEEYRRTLDTYLSFLRQKSKATWIDKGDDNTRLFHQSIKARRYANKIHSIRDGSGEWVNTGEKVDEAFVKYYTELLGKQL